MCVQEMMLIQSFTGELMFQFSFFLADVFCKVEMPSQYCLALLELNGIGFSTAECESQKHIMQAKLDAIESQAYQLAGHSFSFTNSDDIAEVVSWEQGILEKYFLELKMICVYVYVYPKYVYLTIKYQLNNSVIRALWRQSILASTL